MPNNPGADMVGAVLFHPYSLSGFQNPERIYQKDLPGIVSLDPKIGFLQANERAKPFLATEWGTGNSQGAYTPDQQIADLARRTMALLQNGTSLSVMWEYDSPTLGTECNPCNQRTGSAVITLLGTADNAVYDWLNGKTFKGCQTFLNNGTQPTTTIRCGLGEPGNTSYQAEIAWECTGSTIDECAKGNDITTLDCSLFNNAWCGSTSYAAPSYVTQWRDLAGGLPHTGMPTMIGAKPILAESGPGTEP
jgi:hypothetical protein